MKLTDITDPQFLKKLNITELEDLSTEIREFLIQNISKTGGHFSSNLGIVELTVALHYVFNSPQDKLVFDVGHQSYVHKILTGRAKDFPKLRKYGGLSGFQKRKESIHDHWEAGHSSTAISAGVGMAIARDLNQDRGEIICIVGDAALMSGESFEALNHLGSINSKVIIILNDNDMSISKNVGGLSNFLSDIRISTQYKNVKNNYISFLNQSQVGKKIYKFTKQLKDKMKQNILDDNIFMEFGLDYIGPINGHDFHDLINALEVAKKLDHSVVVHVHTTKGKGYPLAEHDRKGAYHGVSPFDYRIGLQSSTDSSSTSWSHIVASQVKKWMEKDENVVTITPAMISGCCLEECFQSFPKRCFDVGIAEEHAMTLAAGLSAAGKLPFITIYSSFLQRAYDQLNHDIARMDLPCLVGIDRSGLVGADGETHHGVFDIGLLTPLPNFIIMTPKNALEARQMINTALHNRNHPYAMRFPKGSIIDSEVDVDEIITVGSWEKVIYQKEQNLTIITYDAKVEKVQKMICEHKLSVNLINARFIKPLDEHMLNELSQDKQKLIIYETDMLTGSLGQLISLYYSQKHMNMDIEYMGIGDHYVSQGDIDTLLAHEKINIDDLLEKIEVENGKERKS